MTKIPSSRVISPIPSTSISNERRSSETVSSKEVSQPRVLSPDLGYNSQTKRSVSPIPGTSIPIQRGSTPTKSINDGNYEHYSKSSTVRNASSTTMSSHSTFKRCSSPGISIPIQRGSLTAVTDGATISESATFEKQGLSDCSRESSISSSLTPSNMIIPNYNEDNISNHDKEFLSLSQSSRQNSRSPLPASYLRNGKSNSPLPRAISPSTCRGSQMLKARSPAKTKPTELQSSANFEKKSSIVTRESILQRRISKYTSSSSYPSVQALRSKLEIQSQGHINPSPEQSKIFESELSKLESATSLLNSALPRKTSESSSIGSNRQSLIEFNDNQFESYLHNDQLRGSIQNDNFSSNGNAANNHGQNIDESSKTAAVLQIPLSDETKQNSLTVPIETSKEKDYELFKQSNLPDEKLVSNTQNKEEKHLTYTQSNNNLTESLFGNACNVDINSKTSGMKFSNDISASNIVNDYQTTGNNNENATDQCTEMIDKPVVNPSNAGNEAPPLPPKKAPRKYLYTPQNATSANNSTLPEAMTSMNQQNKSKKKHKSFTNDFDALSQDCYRALAASRKAAENLENLMAANSFVSNGSSDNPGANDVIDTLNTNEFKEVDNNVTLEENNDYVNIYSPSNSNDTANQYSKLKADQNNLAEKYAAAIINDAIDTQSEITNAKIDSDDIIITDTIIGGLGENNGLIINKDKIRSVSIGEVNDNTNISDKLASDIAAVTENSSRLSENKSETANNYNTGLANKVADHSVDKEDGVHNDVAELTEHSGALVSNSTSKINAIISGENNLADNYTTAGCKVESGVGVNVESGAGDNVGSVDGEIFGTEAMEDKDSAAGVTQSPGGQQQQNYENLDRTTRDKIRDLKG